MADEEFDACEYLWRNELIVQRLLSILRQTQNYCNDIECFNFSRLPGPRDGPAQSNFFITCLIIGFIILMYTLRPKSLRQAQKDNNESRNDGSDPSGDPPAPPPSVH